MNNNFQYQGERFADIQMLRYQLPGFESLSLNQKLYIYYLSEATLWGRDITFDQFGKYNLLIRSTLENIYTTNKDNLTGTPEFDKLTEYLKRVWFSNGIYHHYGCEKFKPEFSQSFFENICRKTLGEEVEEILKQITPIIFNPSILPKRVNKANNEDLIKTSACNYYENVSQQEVEDYYSTLSDKNDPEPPSYGLNSTLIKKADGSLHEEVWRIGGKYSDIIEHIVENLEKASEYAENEQQRKIIFLLIEYYKTGDLCIFDRYSIEWLKELEGNIDFINGFIEVYGDPLGIKASWEGIVEYKDLEACHRTQTICQNAQWFEDHSPVDPRFRKKEVKGVSANVICAAMLGGDEYPSTAIGINLPNADWIRAQYGSKSITISNITHAYNEAGKGCLGHGSGQLLPGTDPNALKNYSSTIEEARADLFGLYYIADPKLVELYLLDDEEAYKSQYYTYLMNGLLTQSVRIKLGDNIEEAHMRNRALIANWTYAHADGAMELVKHTEGDTTKTYLKINDYTRLRELFATLLAEIQRIKSEGDLEAARNIVETYGVKLNPELHKEILDRYEHLNIAPYKGFLNPRLTLVKEGETVKDVTVSYDETLDEQMLRYSREYSV